MNTTKKSPFVFYVADVIRNGITDYRTQTGPSPTRIGPAMIAIPEGGEVTVSATLNPLGEAVMVDADISAKLQGECVRCLAPLTPQSDLHVTQVFALTEDFIQGDEAEDEDDELPLVEKDHIDLLQTVLDEAGMTLPFNPVCPDGCTNEDTPAPDGESEKAQEEKVDPRWAGLEKFL